VSTTTMNENSALNSQSDPCMWLTSPLSSLHLFPHCGTVASSKLQWKTFCRVSKPRRKPLLDAQPAPYTELKIIAELSWHNL